MESRNFLLISIMCTLKGGHKHFSLFRWSKKKTLTAAYLNAFFRIPVFFVALRKTTILYRKLVGLNFLLEFFYNVVR